MHVSKSLRSQAQHWALEFVRLNAKGKWKRERAGLGKYLGGCLLWTGRSLPFRKNHF